MGVMTPFKGKRGKKRLEIKTPIYTPGKLVLKGDILDLTLPVHLNYLKSFQKNTTALGSPPNSDLFAAGWVGC